MCREHLRTNTFVRAQFFLLGFRTVIGLLQGVGAFEFNELLSPLLNFDLCLEFVFLNGALLLDSLGPGAGSWRL